MVEPLPSAGVAYFEALCAAFTQACERVTPTEITYDVGGYRVRAVFASDALYRLMTSAMLHIAVAPDDTSPALTVYFWDTASTGVQTPPPPWKLDAYGANGEIIGYNDARIHTQYQPGIDILHMIDRAQDKAIYWIADAARIPYWEASFPMRTILHWWMQDLPMQLVHAAAVGSSDGGVLITGKSGSGKSTASLACLLYSEFGYVGDDYNLVSFNPLPTAYSLYGTAKLEPDNLFRFPALHQSITNGDALMSEKALIYINERYPDKMLRAFPIKAVIVPRVAHQRDTRLLPGSAIASLTALAPTTLFHLPRARAASFEKMARLVKSVPHYVLETGTDLAQIPATLERLLRSEVQFA